MQAWSPFYWSDYVADTAHLSLVEHGAYLLLMAHYYNTGKPILANAKAILRIARASTREEKEAVANVLEAYFHHDGESWRHSRIDRELAKGSQIQQLRQENGRKGGLAKAKANATILPEQNPSILQSQSQLQEPKIKSIGTHPTIEEVSSYCKERENQVDSAKWFDYYSSNGWRVGRNPMKDWKAAVRTWEKNSYGGPFNDGHTQTAGRGNGVSGGTVAPPRVNTQAQRAFSNIAAVATVLRGSNRVATEERGPAMADRSLTTGAGQKA